MSEAFLFLLQSQPSHTPIMKSNYSNLEELLTLVFHLLFISIKFM